MTDRPPPARPGPTPRTPRIEVPRTAVTPTTVATAPTPAGVRTGATAGSLAVVGLGPGAAEWVTPEVTAALAVATDLVGYRPYLDRVPERPGLARHGSDNRVEVARARLALDLAHAGRRVVVVSGGDAGIFAMAAAVFEAVEAGDAADRALDITVMPGISAMQAAAARLGAPLGHDFCAISLSDNLKPWPLVVRRLSAAIAGDFVVALYNPASRARPDRIAEALALLRGLAGDARPVMLARAVGRADERIEIATLATVDPARIDMATLVLVGSSATRLIARASGAPWVYTPRSAVADAADALDGASAIPPASPDADGAGVRGADGRPSTAETEA
jgi:precorrin-3B C17-methyltransferase